jgi:flagellar basal-body rod modification protein FlgD
VSSDSVSTTNIWPNYATSNVQQAARKPTTQMGKDQFLQILVTQLRYQDPMQPMEDKEFISQMAQFSALEQTMNMAKEVSSLRQSPGMASGLIGKTISWMDVNTQGVTEMYSGVVDSIVWRDGLQYAQAGGSEIPIDEILSVSDTGTQSTSQSSTNTPAAQSSTNTSAAEPSSDPAVDNTASDPVSTSDTGVGSSG